MHHSLLQTSLLVASVTLVSNVAPVVSAANYQMIKEYAGSNFFNDWTFYDHFDNLTNGDAIFVSASVAASAQLAYVDPGSNHAIIKVDNTSTVPWNEKRNTVRISTNDRYGVGSVWVADMYHLPYGLAVTNFLLHSAQSGPAWWSQSPNWPQGGEIDTLEGVNLAKNNQMGLHTNPGCNLSNPTITTTSSVVSTDCSKFDNNNQGCLIQDGNQAAYGEAFGAAGGGVWVTEMADTGISIWFFSRANVPSSISSNATSIDTSTLGTPTGNWPSAACSMSQFFEPQNLIFDITLCGDFAGAPTIFNQTCSGVCYNDWVVGNGSDYATAYFEIGSVRVYSSDGTNNVIKGGSSSSSGSGSNGNGTGGSSGGNDATASSGNVFLTLGAAAVSLFFGFL